MSKFFGTGKNEKAGAAKTVLTLVVLVLVGVLLFTGEVKAELGDTGVSIKSFMFDETVLFDDITSLELRTSLNAGRRSFGLGGSKISSGTFKNDEFGSYRLCVYNFVKSYIVVRCGEKNDGFQP